MALFSAHLAFAFGLLGNVVSFMVYLAPLPTFYKVYKKKSTEGFQSVPYVVALFSAMLWIYYAFLKSNATLLITINSVGCFIETIYICFYLFYAPKKAKVQTVQLVVLLNVVGFGLILLLTHFLAKGPTCAIIVGWICLVFSLCVFIAPLCIVRQVIRTKSVEYMPFLLSFFLTLSAVMWFFYGLLIKDFNIAIPNVLGFTFGILQMILYVMYKDAKKVVENDQKLPEIKNQIIVLEQDHKLHELAEQIIDVVKLSAMVSSEMATVEEKLNSNIGHELIGDENINVPKEIMIKA
ncbi:bidirectional sugar transporter SWEET14-like [Cornus florida]|uniref:bidirectional sugar transporter SWEET14-like n=1 Tax=Cornus florida TaxID=4283 RepID=UPI002898A9D2|nr:bidirectional sugar transporter SWEET14-like [Cornus florida]